MIVQQETATLSIPASGKEIPLKPTISTIGRSDENDVVLSEAAVSRRHAEIGCENGVWYIQNLSTHNGTEVNSVRLQPGERYPLGRKSRIVIASVCELVFELNSPGTPSAGETQVLSSVQPADSGATTVLSANMRPGSESGATTVLSGATTVLSGATTVLSGATTVLGGNMRPGGESGATTVLDVNVRPTSQPGTQKKGKENNKQKKEKKRGGGAILLILLLLLAAAAGGGYAYLRAQGARYSETVQSMVESPAAGNGAKAVVYDEGKACYVKRYLSADRLLAQTAEEIGAVLHVSSGEDKSLNASLRSLPEDREIAAGSFPADASAQLETWCAKELKSYRDDREIRAFLKKGTGSGSKLAFLDPQSGRYAFGGSYLPASLQAASAEELCGYYTVQTDSEELSAQYDAQGLVKGQGEVVRAELHELSGELFAEESFHSSAPSSLSDGSGSFRATVNGKEIERWLESAVASMLYHAQFTGKLEQESMGEGAKVVAYDEDGEHYVPRFVTEELLAAAPAEVALVAGFRSRMDELSGSTGDGGEFSGKEEVVTVQMIDPKTGKRIAEAEFHAGVPGTGAPLGGSFVSRIADGEIAAWISETTGSYFYNTKVRALMQKEPHEGDVLVVRDEQTGLYVEKYSPSRLGDNASIRGLAVIAPANYRITTERYGVGGGYTSRTVSGKVEQLSITITDLATGKRVASTTLIAEVSESIDSSEDGFVVKVSDEAIAGWILETWGQYLSK